MIQFRHDRERNTNGTSHLRHLNDKMRNTGIGGVVQMTDGIANLPPEVVFGIFQAVAAFSNFTPENDPRGEHDCAVQTIGAHQIVWKIDYYDRTRRLHSPNPADPRVTVRVLTVMLAAEY